MYGKTLIHGPGKIVVGGRTSFTGRRQVNEVLTIKTGRHYLYWQKLHLKRRHYRCSKVHNHWRQLYYSGSLYPRYFKPWHCACQKAGSGGSSGCTGRDPRKCLDWKSGACDAGSDDWEKQHRRSQFCCYPIHS